VILGCVNVVSEEMNPARIAALRLGMGESMTAFTVQINCGSGMQSIDTAYKYIRSGASDLILAGGTEALSHAPLLFRREAVKWFSSLSRARSIIEKFKKMSRFELNYFKPELCCKKYLWPEVRLSYVGLFGVRIELSFNKTNFSYKTLFACPCTHFPFLEHSHDFKPLDCCIGSF